MMMAALEGLVLVGNSLRLPDARVYVVLSGIIIIMMNVMFLTLHCLYSYQRTPLPKRRLNMIRT